MARSLGKSIETAAAAPADQIRDVRVEGKHGRKLVALLLLLLMMMTTGKVTQLVG